VISVIIPTYQDDDSLLKCAEELCHQGDVNGINLEIIIISDGGKMRTETEIELQHMFAGNIFSKLQICRIEHKGRAAARNEGVRRAKGDLLVFLDADRVPMKTLLHRFKRLHFDYPEAVIIGNPRDCFMPPRLRKSGSKEYGRFSRDSMYFRCILSLYRMENDWMGISKSSVRWLSMLIGTSCMTKSIYEKVGGLDESFKDWGLEHFDLGRRICELGTPFIVATTIESYHLIHKRDGLRVTKGIDYGIHHFSEKYGDTNAELLKGFFDGKISIQAIQRVYGEETESPEVFFRI